jgi:hypothetical protein
MTLRTLNGNCTNFYLMELYLVFIYFKVEYKLFLLINFLFLSFTHNAREGKRERE